MSKIKMNKLTTKGIPIGLEIMSSYVAALMQTKAITEADSSVVNRAKKLMELTIQVYNKPDVF